MHANRKDENGSVIGARITVPTDAVPTLTSRSFWPRPAYARRWTFTPSAKPANLEETDYKHDPASNPTDLSVSVDAYERADPEVSSGTQSTPAPDSISEPTSTEGASASFDAGTQENKSPNPDQRKDKQQ